MRILLVGLLLSGYLLALSFISLTFGQDHNHPPQDAALHEEFYNTWNRPDIRNDAGERTASCCNKRDCFPTPIRKVNGQWQALDRQTQKWIVIPDNKMEHNQIDPRESPDGQSHACISPDNEFPFCAVLGSGA